MRITKEEAALLAYSLDEIKHDLPFDKYSASRADKILHINACNNFIKKLEDYSSDGRKGRKGILNDFARRFKKQFLPKYITENDQKKHKEMKAQEEESRRAQS